MLNGPNRYRLRGDRFRVRPNVGPADKRMLGSAAGRSAREQQLAEIAGGYGNPAMSAGGAPQNTTTRAFAKPTGLALGAGLIGTDPASTIMMARDMYDNDAISSGVINILSDIPFGNHSLGGMPDKEYLEPYNRSLDRVRIKTLLPVLARSFMVDGAFLGTGIFSQKDKIFDAIIPQDVLHATITPVPVFGATPIVDLHVTPDQQRMLSTRGDPRYDKFVRMLPEELRRTGLVKLQPENTFYLPRRTLAHVPLGMSMLRSVMIIYLLEKSLARGTIELSYRRQRPILHIMAGDENWDPSQEDLQVLTDLFLAADLDPLGAVVVTRQGVQPQEIGGPGDLWRWTDVVDTLTSLKLKGLGLPDGLLGGDMALDSVSATLTVFINMMRSFRDYITRLLFYEKMFPYISITNDHRRDSLGAFQETGSRFTSRFHADFHRSVASDVDDVDMGNYLTPTVAWHNSMRPEGDKEYMEMLNELTQAGVPIPLRMMAAAGGLDIHDLINSAPDDLEIREKVAEYTAQINQLNDAVQGGDDQGGDQGYSEQGAEAVIRAAAPVKRKSLLTQDYDDRMQPRRERNGPAPMYTTARERKRMNEKADKTIAAATAGVYARLNRLLRVQTVDPLKQPRVPGIFGVSP